MCVKKGPTFVSKFKVEAGRSFLTPTQIKRFRLHGVSKSAIISRTLGSNKGERKQHEESNAKNLYMA